MSNPRLRFKRADGTDYPDWEEKKLGEVLTQRRDIQTISEKAPLLAFTIEDGVIDPKDKKTNKRDFLIKDKENKKFQLTKYDDIIYNPANIKFGAIHRNKFGEGVVSPIYVILKTNQNPSFVEYSLKRESFISKTKKYLEGTVEKLRTLKSENFLSLSVFLPCLEEQEKIGDFLSDIDEVILASDQEVKKLQELKKGAMQKIFSQEVRFKRDDGTDYPDWKEKKLGDICNIYDGTHQTPNYTKTGIKFVSVENINDLYSSQKFISEKDFDKNYKIYPQKGDILMTRIGDIGTPALVSKDEKIAFYVSLALFKPNNIINSKFFVQVLQSNFVKQEFWIRTLHTAFPKKINKKDIGICKLFLPCLEEQEKIGDFLSDFDEAISLAKQELEKWKLLKKGLLQQMFT